MAAAGPVRAVLSRALAAALVLAVLAFPLVFVRPFPRHVMIMIFLYGALATAWNILAGYCGQISLGHAVYFGIGAYTSTLLVRETAFTPWLGMLAGAGLAVLVSQAIGYPVFRLRGHYFAIATIGFGEIVQTVVLNWDRIGGARGLFVPIKRPDSLLNFQFHESKAVYYYIARAAGADARDHAVDRALAARATLSRDSGGPGCGREPRRASPARSTWRWPSRRP